MWYSIIGLGLDIIGVNLLFQYGVLPRRLFDSLLRDHTIDEWKVNIYIYIIDLQHLALHY